MDEEAVDGGRAVMRGSGENLSRARSGLALVLVGGLVLALANCADDAGRAAGAQAAGAPAAVEPEAASRAAPGPAAPGQADASNPSDEGQAGASLQNQARNDPSAPLDTPLCGRAARERIAISAAVEPDVAQGAGACAQTACFDPATDTFIGADGYRHVCQ